jgi:hypothetical protein
MSYNLLKGRPDPGTHRSPSLIPLGVVSGQLLLSPRAASHISTGTVSAYSLTAAAVETIRALEG